MSLAIALKTTKPIVFGLFALIFTACFVYVISY